MILKGNALFVKPGSEGQVEVALLTLNRRLQGIARGPEADSRVPTQDSVLALVLGVGVVGLNRDALQFFLFLIAKIRYTL